VGGGDVGTDPFASVAELLGQRTDLLPQSEDVSDVPALDEAPVDDPQDSDRPIAISVPVAGTPTNDSSSIARRKAGSEPLASSE